MIKHIKIITIPLILLSLALVSCKRDLGASKETLIPKSYADYDLLMNTSDFYGSSNIGIYQPAILMGDDVSAEESQFNNEGLKQSRLLFNWEADIFIPISGQSNSENPLFMFRLLQNVYNLNKVINEVKNSSGGTDQQKLQLQAEAMAMRAFTNFQLNNYFAKPYSSATANSDLGFPIIIGTDTTGQYMRGSVQTVYDFMVMDLMAAIPNLSTQPAYSTQWSKAAAEGFLGKVYLFMGKTPEALAMFNAAFSDMNKMTARPGLYDYNIEFAPGGKFYPSSPVYGRISPFMATTDITESLVALMSYTGSVNRNNFGNDFLTLSEQARLLFDKSDLRLMLYTNLQIDGRPNAGGRLRRYSPSNYLFARIGLELSELYLLRAEAEARTGNLANAKSDLEILRRHRMPVANVPAEIAGNQSELIKFIIDERTREFAQLGYRWFDMRRLSVDPLFSGTAPVKHIKHLINGGTSEVILKPERFTLRFPKVYIDSNLSIVNNP